jgi:hypothetical protein
VLLLQQSANTGCPIFQQTCFLNLNIEIRLPVNETGNLSLSSSIRRRFPGKCMLCSSRDHVVCCTWLYYLK